MAASTVATDYSTEMMISKYAAIAAAGLFAFGLGSCLSRVGF
jgi:hypothetical protein